MAVVQAHHTHNTFYSIWSDAKDRGTELTYPCAVWDRWRTWIGEDGAGALNRSVAVRLLIVTAVATDRTPGDRDTAVEEADQAAEDYILKLRELYPDMAITNVATTTQFDEYTQLETGVILSFTATGGPLCLDGSAFGPVCAAGVVVNSNGTFTLSAPSGGTITLPDVTHTDSDGSPVTLPAMTPFLAGATSAEVTVRNSSDTYHVAASAPGTLVLPDVTHTDSNGLSAVRPAMTPFVATLCPVRPDDVLHEFTVSGSINKPPSPLYKGRWVLAVGGGGGGGAGRINVSTRPGGGGGGGGCIVCAWIPAVDVLPIETFAIGAGGVGGTGNGSAGGAGGSTSFGAHIVARGGTGGPSAVSTPANNGLATLCTPPGGTVSLSGAKPTASDYTTMDRTGVHGLSGSAAAPSGGGGGGSSSGNVSNAGYAGGGVYDGSDLVPGPPAPSSTQSGKPGASNAVLLSLLDHMSSIGIGTAGAGGGSGSAVSSIAPGYGGNGGLYGAGGGGGGGAAMPGSSVPVGRGGDGAQGCLLVLDVF